MIFNQNQLEDQYGRTPSNASTLEAFREEDSEVMEKCPEDRPLSFSGEVYCISDLQIEDKIVFLVLDTREGIFKHYSSRIQYMDEEPPDISFPIREIQNVRNTVNSSIEGKFFFVIETPENSLEYYCQYLDMTVEWTNRVREAVDFFHMLSNHRSREEEELKEARNTLMGKRFKRHEEELLGEENPQLSLQSFEVLEDIGTGSFGKVCKVLKKSTNEIFALKSLNKNTLKIKKQEKYARAECKILKNIRHPFIVPLYSVFQSPKCIFMVLEFCQFGDFSRLLSVMKQLKDQQAKFYIAEVILAIEYLHSLNIVYRDLKPSNLLIDSQGHIKLSDFGLAKQNVTEDNPAMSFCGSPAYLAPEMIARAGAGKPADIYCIGANLYEMLTGQPPFYTEDVMVLYKRIANARIRFPNDISESAKDLIQQMMKRIPEERPTVSQLKRHKYFKGINWDHLLLKKIKPPLSSEELTYLLAAESSIEPSCDE